jgi:hypothetical protein
MDIGIFLSTSAHPAQVVSCTFPLLKILIIPGISPDSISGITASFAKDVPLSRQGVFTCPQYPDANPVIIAAKTSDFQLNFICFFLLVLSIT